jgi:hypothetical protein
VLNLNLQLLVKISSFLSFTPHLNVGKERKEEILTENSEGKM